MVVFSQTVAFDVIHLSQDCDCCCATSFCHTLSVPSVTLAAVGHVCETFRPPFLLLPSFQKTGRRRSQIKSDRPVMVNANERDTGKC